MTEPLLTRSAMYTPGSNPSALAKAVRSAADVLIFDLEDAVAPESKLAAREAVASFLPSLVASRRATVVRVNAIGSAWCEEDVATVVGLDPTAVLFPKISTPDDVQLAAAMLSFYGAPQQTELWCMIETPLAILNAATLAACAARTNSRMTTWVLGTNDLVKELRAKPSPSRSELLPLLAIAVAAARAHGLRILDGVHNSIDDPAGFEWTCRQGRDMGFDGRTLIHPSQIETCHRAYSPTMDEIEEARAIVKAFELPENRGKGAIKLKGRMVELLHEAIARGTLRIGEAIAATERGSPARQGLG